MCKHKNHFNQAFLVFLFETPITRSNFNFHGNSSYGVQLYKSGIFYTTLARNMPLRKE